MLPAAILITVKTKIHKRMKKFITAILLAVAMALPSQAQISFGLKGGLNLTSLSLDNSTAEKGISNKSGFYIGPTAKFTLPIVGLGVDASILYDQRQAKVKATDESIKMQTIQIPINARYSFGLGDIASIFLFAGPQFGFNVGSKDKKYNVGDLSFKSAQISGNVGIGAMFINHLQVNVNYNFALSKSAEISYGGNNVKAKGNAWQIGVAYYF